MYQVPSESSLDELAPLGSGRRDHELEEKRGEESRIQAEPSDRPM